MCRPNKFGWLLLLVGWWLCAISFGQAEPVAGDLDAARLTAANLKTDAESLIAFLDSQRPSTDQQTMIAELLAQLDSSLFVERENASLALQNLGHVAKPFLSSDREDSPPESKSRIDVLLARLDSSDFEKNRIELLSAVVKQLERLSDDRAIESLFLTLVDTSAATESRLQSQIQKSIWACSRNAKQDSRRRTIEFYLTHSDDLLRGTAIIAYEIAAGEQAIPRLTPMLADPSETIRLATCRALIDRVPQKTTPALLELVESVNRTISASAISLLALQTGAEVKFGKDIRQTEYWRDVTSQLDPSNLRKLGAARLDLKLRAGRILETFSTDVADATDGYGNFQFEASEPSKAFVKDGRLVFSGKNPEADQSLFLTAESLTGDSQLPDEFTVRAKLGGTQGGSGVFHVGISIGELKLLFHPGLHGGQFRIEDRQTHTPILNNRNMGFTPAMGKLHEMCIFVTRQPSEAADDSDDRYVLEIQIQDHNSDAVFKTRQTFIRKDVGKLSRIGLERSGRTGGDGNFSEFEFIPSVD